MLLSVCALPQAQLGKFDIVCRGAIQNIYNANVANIHNSELYDQVYCYIMPYTTGFCDSCILSYNWSLPGATPSTSTLKNPVVVYNNLGTYDVSLTVTTAFGDTTIYHPNYMRIKERTFHIASLLNERVYINNFQFNGAFKQSGQGITGNMWWGYNGGNDLYGFQDLSDTVYRLDVSTGKPYYGSSARAINPPLTSINAGSNYAFTINTVYIGNPFNINVAMWIDADYDGVFSPAEMFYSLSHIQNTIITDSVTIPALCHLGNTKMRIMVTDDNSPTAYEANPYMWPMWSGQWPRGEAEDYTVNVLPSLNPIIQPLSDNNGKGKGKGHNKSIGKTTDVSISDDIIIYPNPVKDEFVIEGNYIIYSIFANDGTLVKTGLRSDKVLIDELPNGIYFIRIVGDNVVTKKLIKH